VTDDAHTTPGILLIGRSGMLARAWRDCLDASQTPYTIIGRPELDLTSPATIQRAVTDRFDTIINCAAWTDVDGAEEHEAEATQVNGHGVGALARRCAAIGATLVHYSTDYVFSGQASTPYTPDQPRDPLNAYGRSKAEGERQIEQSGAEHLIIRTSWLYAPWGKNFVSTMARLTQEREALRVVNDQRGRPTSAEHLARASFALVQQGARGIHHVTDGGECTWFELACAIRDHLSADCHIDPCTSEEFPRPATRPAYSVLGLDKTERVLGPMPEWQDQVASALDTMTASSK
jgi:dTDP-4-dehydrorhamnose reductase